MNPISAIGSSFGDSSGFFPAFPLKRSSIHLSATISFPVSISSPARFSTSANSSSEGAMDFIQSGNSPCAISSSFDKGSSKIELSSSGAPEDESHPASRIKSGIFSSSACSSEAEADPNSLSSSLTFNHAGCSSSSWSSLIPNVSPHPLAN